MDATCDLGKPHVAFVERTVLCVQVAATSSIRIADAATAAFNILLGQQTHLSVFF